MSNHLLLSLFASSHQIECNFSSCLFNQRQTVVNTSVVSTKQVFDGGSSLSHTFRPSLALQKHFGEKMFSFSSLKTQSSTPRVIQHALFFNFFNSKVDLIIPSIALHFESISKHFRSILKQKLHFLRHIKKENVWFSQWLELELSFKILRNALSKKVD